MNDFGKKKDYEWNVISTPFQWYMMYGISQCLRKAYHYIESLNPN